MDNCIFCKIIKGEIPCAKIYEDDKFFCFLDINPVSKGHTLLIPKEHHMWMHETPDELLGETFLSAKKIMNTLRETIPCDFVQVSVIGKEVPHFHVHLIPRLLNDNIEEHKKISYENDEEKVSLALKIKNTLSK